MYRSPFDRAELPPASRPDTVPAPGRTAARPALNRYRIALVSGCILVFAAAVALFEPADHWARDPELFRLLRGMGAIKAVLALVGIAAVWWRLGQTLSTRLARTYIGGALGMALGTGLIWQLTAVPFASGLFHAATLVLLIAAWREASAR